MVAQATLTRLVMVRIHVGQPFDALTLAHGLRPAHRKTGDSSRAKDASNGPEQAGATRRRAERAASICCRKVEFSRWMHAGLIFIFSSDFSISCRIILSSLPQSRSVPPSLHANMLFTSCAANSVRSTSAVPLIYPQRLDDHVAGHAFMTIRRDPPETILGLSFV